MTKTTVIFVRHGESMWNRAGRIQGQKDPELTGLGRAQARQVAERLAMESADIIFSSDSKRAAATAGAICQRLNLPLHLDERLREISVGSWEGLTTAEAEARYPEEFAAWRKDFSRARGGGETRAELTERAWQAVSEIVAANPGKHIVIVSHGGTIQAVAAHILGLEPPNYGLLRGLENCSMTWLEFEEGIPPKVKRYNVPAFGVAALGDTEDELGEAQ